LAHGCSSVTEEIKILYSTDCFQVLHNALADQVTLLRVRH
jgi:hypothetical protein